LKSSFIALISAALISSAAAGTITITPTTTLAAQTSNNTSASSSFTGTSNGNVAPKGVSKLPIRSLLYPGATTKVYVHVQPWWGKSSHINIGYDSADTAQAERQVKDMISRGIDGAIMDYYGPTSTHNEKATLALLKAAETHPGFEFAVGEDGNALKGASSPTSKIISDLKHVYYTYMNSSAYMRKNGRPVVTFFGTEAYNIDWAKVRANVLGNPLFLFRNSKGFTVSQSNGAYSWIGSASSSTDMGLSYLTNFYKVANSWDSKKTVGSAYKGFNDSIASWGKDRKVTQACGQTWLATFAEISKHYSTSNPLESIQLNTWNDYEEGTEIETGIDNCVKVSASVSGGTLSWSLSGKENTIDHYSIYVSTDGKNLMKLTEAKVGIRSINVGNYSLARGTYYFYVKAVGRATFTNQISGAATYKKY
jgi:hypothetical protein